MNNHSLLRLQLAQARAEVLATDPNIIAMAVTGSVADDRADDTSDIDLLVFTQAPLSEAAFKQMCDAAIASGGGIHGGTATEGFAIYEYMQGVRCDLGFDTVGQAESVMRSVLEATEINLVNQLIVSGFLKAIPLHGQDWIDGWKARLSAYPPALAALMVKQHLKFYPRWIIQKMGVDRHEKMFLYENYLEAGKNIVAVLCGLNRVYHPGKWKGIAGTINQLTIAPPGLLSRLEGLFTAAPAAAAADLDALIEETFALVEAHMPAVDAAAIRKRYIIDRQR